jgi:hypothetical protein
MEDIFEDGQAPHRAIQLMMMIKMTMITTTTMMAGIFLEGLRKAMTNITASVR